MSSIDLPAPKGTPAWQAAIIAATIAGTLATACMMPFVALAVANAATMPRSRAAATVGAAWLLNQLLGFGVLGYPTDPTTIAWGLALGVAGLAAMLAAAAVLESGRITPLRLVAAFAYSFAVYEAGLFAFALLAGGTSTFTVPIIGRIFLNDSGWCAALFAFHTVLTRAAPRTFGQPLRLASA